MVVVNRFRWFGWFVLCVAVILASYITSSRVAAERKKLADVERAIASTDREIKALETEFDTRANLAQLQRWNGDTLKLTVPTAEQYVADEAQLADVDFDARAPEGARIQTAAVMPSAPDLPAQARAVEAVAEAPAVKVQPARPVTVASASMARMPEAPRGTLKLTRAASVARPRTVAMLDRKLLSESTLGDLIAGSKAERRAR